jgi:hypothetical protein
MMSKQESSQRDSQPLSKPSIPKIYSYQHDVLDRIDRLPADFKVQTLGVIPGSSGEKHPLLVIRRTVDRSVPTILVSAGVHGEEPAGVFALLDFLEGGSGQLDRKKLNLLALPCINPVGFEYGVRFGSGGVDLNRNFKSDTVQPENLLVQRAIAQAGGPFLATLDLHEIDPEWSAEGFVASDNPRDFYLYECCEQKERRIGHHLVAAAEQISPACKWDRIYLDKNSGGVVWYPEGAANPVYALGTTLEGYLQAGYTKHAFTLETPAGLLISVRVRLQRSFLETAIQHLA